MVEEQKSQTDRWEGGINTAVEGGGVGGIGRLLGGMSGIGGFFPLPLSSNPPLQMKRPKTMPRLTRYQRQQHPCHRPLYLLHLVPIEGGCKFRWERGKRFRPGGRFEIAWTGDFCCFGVDPIRMGPGVSCVIKGTEWRRGKRGRLTEILYNL